MLFRRRHERRNDDWERRYALYEIAYTCVDFAAAILFVVGSVLFFQEETKHAGTWLFLLGSICFALKPTIRLIREIRLVARGDRKNVAKKYDP